MDEPALRDVVPWLEKGQAHLQCLEYGEALDCLRQALILKANLPEGWLQYGAILEKLGCYGAAIAANTNAQKLYANPRLIVAPPASDANDAIAAALSLQASNPDYWLQRGHALCDLGRYETAIASYDKALELRPQEAEAWFGRGNMIAALGDFETAIASYDKALDLQPQNYQAWNNRGCLLHLLTKYEAAITSYDQAISHQPDFYPAWNNRGYARSHLGQHEAAIAEFDQALALHPDYPEAWNNRANALRDLGQFEAAIIDYDKALALKADFEEARENRALAQQSLQNKTTLSTAVVGTSAIMWIERGNELLRQERYEEAISHYRKALNGAQLTHPAELQETSTHLQWVLKNIDLPPHLQIALEEQFFRFNQLWVDALVPLDPVQALELAEATKNQKLASLRHGWSHPCPHPTYSQIQDLLAPHTAAIYWHLSPVALTTFILKHHQPPQVLPPKPVPISPHESSPPCSPSAYQLRELETWLRCWKQDYTRDRDLPPQTQPTAPWRQRMEWMLYARLPTILEIQRLCLDHLQDIEHLILIPHRDLHLIPLHALFPEQYTITYLPSAQLGLELNKLTTPSAHRLLNLEPPPLLWVNSMGSASPTPNAQLESALVTYLYGKAFTQSIPLENATKSRVTAALKLMSGCLHFTGQSYHNLENPTQSALTLADEEQLTLQDLWQLDLQRYNLVCLSPCEPGLTPLHPIHDEYIGLVSGFLSAGVAHVLSTLWPVDEISSTLLRVEFHRHLLWNALPPAQALAQAQKWLRTATHADLSQWYQARHAELIKIAPYRGLTAQVQHLATAATHATNPQEAPFAHPYYWAGFTLTGKVPRSTRATPPRESP